MAVITNALIPPPEDEALVEPAVHVIAKNILEARKRKLKSAPTQMDLAEAITDIQYNPLMKGANSIILTLYDPDWVILDSGIFDTDQNSMLDPIDLNYPDGSRYWWRLTIVSPKASHTLTLTFIVREAVYLMNHKGPIRGDRAKMTRAEFMQMLTKKVKEGPIEFHSKELRIKEPIAAAATSSSSASSGVKGTTPAGAGLPSVGAKAWRVKFSLELASSGNGWTELSSNGNGAAAAGHVRTATGQGGWDFASLGKAYPRGTLMRITNPTNGKSGIFPMTDVGDGSAFAPAIGLTPTPIAALGLTSSDTVVDIELADGSAMNVVSGFGTPTSGSSIVPGPGGAASSKVTTVQAYYFEVLPNEDYWTAMVRLAGEVNWELFFDGNRLYYDSETELIKLPAVATISREDDAVIDWNYDWDARAICTQMSLVVICAMFDFPAGGVLVLKNFGPASTGSTATPRLPGHWLIESFQRNKGDITTALKLKQPEKQKLEPAPQISSTGGAGGTASGAALNSGNASLDKAYAEASKIDKQNLTYSWGGGHGTNGVPGGPSNGYDCSGYVSAILGAGGMLSSPLDSGSLMSWGQAGEGKLMTVWANSGHVYIEWKVPGAAKRADTVWDGSGPRGPHLRTGWPPPEGTGSFTPRHWPGL